VVSRKWVLRSALLSLAGKLTFVSQAVLGGHTFARRVYDACQGSFPKVPISSSLSADLFWWCRYLRTFNGRLSIHWSTFRLIAYCSTDASNVASCGVCPFPSAWVHAWTDKQDWHINIRELWAVYHSLLTWGPKWANHDVAVATDNTSVLAWINSGTSKSPQAMSLLRKIFWIQASRNL
jgi:hypothetical protein